MNSSQIKTKCLTKNSHFLFQMRSKRKKLNLLNMNDDCQMLIFEQMHLIELISMTETNSNFFYFTQRILRQKLAKKEMVFRNPYVSEDVRNHVKEFDDRIEIQHWPTIEKMLKYFGHLIRKLEVLHRKKLTAIESAHIFRQINAQCSNTLIQLRIINNGFNDIFTGLKSPFKKMEYFVLYGEYLKFNQTEFAFNKLFPKLSKLYLDADQIEDLGLCDITLEHLQQLSTENQGDDHRNAVTKIIRNHPQLRSLTLKYVDSSLLQFVAEELHHLEQLEIHYFDKDNQDGECFNFEHLKSFSVKSAQDAMPSNLTFRDLEEFEIVAFERNPQLIEQVLQFKQNLKKLHLIIPLDNNDIVQLALAKLNVIEISIKCGKEIDLANIVMLLNSCRLLNNLFIFNESDDFRRLTIDSFLERKYNYRHNWTINEIGGQIVFKRIEA